MKYRVWLLVSFTARVNEMLGQMERKDDIRIDLLRYCEVKEQDSHVVLPVTLSRSDGTNEGR